MTFRYNDTKNKQTLYLLLSTWWKLVWKFSNEQTMFDLFFRNTFDDEEKKLSENPLYTVTFFRNCCLYAQCTLDCCRSTLKLHNAIIRLWCTSFLTKYKRPLSIKAMPYYACRMCVHVTVYCENTCKTHTTWYLWLRFTFSQFKQLKARDVTLMPSVKRSKKRAYLKEMNHSIIVLSCWVLVEAAQNNYQTIGMYFALLFKVYSIA